MIKLDLLDAFVPYVTNPPIIAPEDEKNLKKFRSYMVLAHNIEEGYSFFTNNKTLKFRHIYNYFVEKRWDHKLYGQARVVTKMDADASITKLVESNRSGNTKNVTGVTSYLPSSKARPMKNLNTIVEINHITDEVLNNPKDSRILSKTVDDLVRELTRVMDTSYLGEYTNTIFIPIELWFTKEELDNHLRNIRPLSKNPMGVLLSRLANPEVMTKFGKIVLTYGRYVLILDPSVTNTSKGATIDSDFVLSAIHKFCDKCRKASLPNAEPDAAKAVVDDKDIADDKAAKDTMDIAEKKTTRAVRVDDTLKRAKVDPDRVKPETKEALAKAIDTAQDGADINPIYLDVPSETEDIILKAALEGRSASSTKRNEMLKEKLAERKFGDTPMSDIVEAQEVVNVPDLPVKANTIDKSMNSIKAHNFERTYNDTLMQVDLIRILQHFGTVEPAMYLSKDITIEDVSTSTDRAIKYTIEYEDENRKRHRFAFRMPKMYKEKYLYLNDMMLNITHQKLPFPVTKVSADRCQLVTNYNKLFIYRYGSNMSPKVTKLKKLLTQQNNYNKITVKRGDCSHVNTNDITTIEYDELGKVFVRLDIGTSPSIVSIHFAIEDVLPMVDMAKKPKVAKITSTTMNEAVGVTDIDDSLIPIGVHRVNKERRIIWLSGTSNHVYSADGTDNGELSDYIINLIGEYEPKLATEFDNVSAGTKFMYSRIHIMDFEVPTILVMAAACRYGLVEAMNTGNINYEFTEKRPKIDKDAQGIIPFSDGYLVYDRYPYENSLLMNGLSVLPTKEYEFTSMNDRDIYAEVFDNMFGRRTIAANIQSFYYMMVDPITKDILEQLNMPTTFTKLLHYCNGVLADNTFQSDCNYDNSRLRSNETINAYLYRELAVAWSRFKSEKIEKFSIPEDAIIKKCLMSNIIDPHSKLNISLEMENDRQVKLKGPSGMNEDHSFTLDKRAYHPSMAGVIGMNTTPAGDVGISRHLTLNSNITNARGFIDIHRGEYEGTELMTPAEALQVFGTEAADGERLAMAISQSKQVVPVSSHSSSPISYDMERVAPYLSTDFATTAKGDGKVIEIDNDIMIVQYKDGTYDDIDLAEKPDNNTDGGFFIMNQQTPRFKVGQSFKAGDLLATDKKYINDNDMFNDPCASVGTLARVMLEHSGLVYEDSGYITEDFANRLATRITKQKRIVLTRFANITYIVKKGQHITANDPLIAFDDTEDEFASAMLANIAAEADSDDTIIGTSVPVVSKHTGVVKDIQIYYTIPLEEMTPSMRKIVSEYSRDMGKREKTLSKYMKVYDANTLTKPSKMSVPDSLGKVKGVKIGEGVFIDFFIEYLDVMSNGDKGSAYTALKFTDCTIIPSELAAFTDFNPDRKIDLCISALGMFKRMTLDMPKVGVLTKVLVEEKRKYFELFGERLTNELKKK